MVQTLKRRKLNFEKIGPSHSNIVPEFSNDKGGTLGQKEFETIIISDSEGETDISGMQPLEKIEYDNF